MHHNFFEYLPAFYYSSYFGVILPVYASFPPESPIQPYGRTGGTYLVENIKNDLGIPGLYFYTQYGNIPYRYTLQVRNLQNYWKTHKIVKLIVLINFDAIDGQIKYDTNSTTRLLPTNTLNLLILLETRHDRDSK